MKNRANLWRLFYLFKFSPMPWCVGGMAKAAGVSEQTIYTTMKEIGIQYFINVHTNKRTKYFLFSWLRQEADWCDKEGKARRKQLQEAFKKEMINALLEEGLNKKEAVAVVQKYEAKYAGLSF